MRSLRRFDRFLLDQIFEPFAHWFQELTGLDNFWLAKVTAFLGNIAPAIFEFITRPDSPTRWIDPFIATFAFFVFFRFVEHTEESEREGIERGFANSLRLWSNDRLFLANMLLFTALLHRSWIDLYWFSHLTSMFYFNSCTPLPPGKSKIKQWLEKAVSALRQNLVPSPVPAT